MATKSLLNLCLLVCFVQHALCLEGLEGVGGTFMYGHISWESQTGNVVNFRIEASYRRQVLTDFWKGGNAQIGDILLMSDVGIGTTVFYFGDGSFSDDLRLRVTGYSQLENWVIGDLVLTHEYPSPSNGGLPWIASLSGCCRMESLVNQKDSDYDIKAYVNLLESRHSPVARMIPMVTAYIQTTGSQMSNVFVNADDPKGTETIEWSVGLPWDVGNAANFSASKNSFASVSLYALQSPTGECGSEKCQCDAVTPGQTMGLSIGPSCLFNLLRTNITAGTNDLTVEGWVNARAAGYVVTTGPDRCYYDEYGVKQCAMSQPPSFCANFPSPTLACSISTLLVQVNETHVIVGHETAASGGSLVPVLLAFSCSSNPEVCSSDNPSLLNRWIHIAVIRKMTNPSGMVTYKVYVNGRLLEGSTYPAGDRSNGQTAGETHIYTLGESVQQVGPRTGNMDNLNFAVGTAIVFGAKLSVSNFLDSAFLDGQLDEWRFWRGERSVQEIQLLMQRNLVPDLSTIYGEPDSLDRTSRILATYSFDQTPPFVQTDACTRLGQLPCALDRMYPVFPSPQDPRAMLLGPNKRKLYEALGNNVVSSPAGVYYTQAAASVKNGMLTLLAPAPGYYQVTVHAALSGGRAKVPIDFIVWVVRSFWTSVGDTTCPLTMPPLPIDQFYRLDQNGPLLGNGYAPSLAIRSHVSDASDGTSGCALSASCRSKYMGREAAWKALADSTRVLTAPLCRIQAVAGSEVELILASSDGDDYQDPAAIGQRVMSQVGFTVGSVPEKLHMTTVYAADGASGVREWRMNASWWTCGEDVGNHTICFEAVDTTRYLNGSFPTVDSGGVTQRVASANSPPQCVKLEVMAPSPPEMLFYTADATFQKNLESVSSVQLTMGVESYLVVAAQTDNCVERLSIQGAITADGPSLPDGMQLVPLDTMGATIGQTCPLSGAGMACVCPMSLVGVRWTPGLKYGGMSRPVCFEALEASSQAASRCVGMAAQRATKCLMINVQRCKFALSMDQELQEIASAFRIDWMRLWSLNAEVLHPDYVVYADQVLWVGHLLRAVGGETPAGVAQRMGMELKLLQMLNNDINTSLPLQPGQVVCVVPNSCGGTAATVYTSIDYKDDSFFASQLADTLPVPGQLAAQLMQQYP